jgi:hypothetical protein
MCSTKAKAYVTAMKSDLRNLVSEQESFFAKHGRYARSARELGFRASTGVNVPAIVASDAGFYATTSHTQLAGSCIVYVGQRPAAIAATQAADGEPRCEGIVAGSRVDLMDRTLANGLFVMLAAVTLSAIFFLSRGRGKWTAASLFAITLAFPVVVYPLCGPGASMFGALGLAGLGLALFVHTLRNKLRSSTNAPA